MFTGIVEETGVVERIHKGRRSTELYVRPKSVGRALRIGNSIAVNGACLTVADKRGAILRFDVLNETLVRTNFSELERGSLVNLERPLRADGRLDGHFVQGHVDGTGVVRRYEKSGTDYVLEVEAPADIMRYIVQKGSISVDGISLTVAAFGKSWFRIWIIPHTHGITNLLARRAGQRVNLESDMLAKHLERFFRVRRSRML